ncbi:MAG: hypothetical protein F6K30_07395 [Cyanothece sp. SIO2G6]|nr:hypothetical protein [Cyanothece sp. SIO2G6]
MSSSFEVDMQTIEHLAHQTQWQNFPHDVIRENPLALAFMTPKAFAWLLPAYLNTSVTLYSETDTLTTSIITCLTPPDEADARQFETLSEETRTLDAGLLEEDLTNSLGADDELLQLFIDRASLLTQDEKAAVRDYLQYIDVSYGEDFPAFGPKQALDRYWATGDFEKRGRSL